MGVHVAVGVCVAVGGHVAVGVHVLTSRLSRPDEQLKTQQLLKYSNFLPIGAFWYGSFTMERYTVGILFSLRHYNSDNFLSRRLNIHKINLKNE